MIVEVLFVDYNFCFIGWNFFFFVFLFLGNFNGSFYVFGFGVYWEYFIKIEVGG